MKRYSDIWYQSTDGLTLYARDYANGDTATTVLCMHGLTRNSADFTDLSEHLSPRYRVIAVDQRGRGLSEYDSTPSHYNPSVYVQDMITLLDHLKLDQVILIGTSLGGLMSMMMSSIIPGRIQAAVLNDIGPDINPIGLERIKAYVKRSAPVTDWASAAAKVKSTIGSEFPYLTDRQWLKFAHNLYRENDQGMLELAYDPAISQPMQHDGAESAPVDLWPVFAAMKSIPTLLIRGALSDILSCECVEKMRQLKPDLHYVQVPQCGHAPLLNESESITAIDCFLTTVVSSH